MDRVNFGLLAKIKPMKTSSLINRAKPRSPGPKYRGSYAGAESLRAQTRSRNPRRLERAHARLRNLCETWTEEGFPHSDPMDWEARV